MTVVDELLAAFEPWMTDDLATFLSAVGSMAAEVESVLQVDPARLEALELDEDEVDLDIGYGQLMDPDMTPDLALPWLALFVGERFPSTIGADQQRPWILDRPNSRRGTLISIANAAQRNLIGERFVTFVERSDGTAGDHPDDVTILVYTDETPDPAQTERDIRDTFPLELSLNFQVIDATTWQQVALANASWGAAGLAGKSWGDVASGRSGGIYYGGD